VGLVFDEAVVRPGNFEGRDDAEAYLRSLGIKDVNLEGITRVESLNEIGQAVEVVHDRYPWMAEKFGTTRGLNRVVTNTERLEHFGAAAQVRGTTAGIEISLRPGIFNDSTVMSLMAAGDGSHFSTVLHELGHVAERTLVGAGRVSAPSAFSATVGNGPWAGLQRGRRMFLREVSMYAEESGAEFFAEMFEIKNRTGYAGHLKNAYWRREAVPAAALKRLEAAERWIEDQLSGPLTTGRLGIDPEDIL